MSRRRPDGIVFYLYRRRWPTVVAAGLGLVALWLVWSLTGFLLGALAGFVVYTIAYRSFHRSGRRH